MDPEQLSTPEAQAAAEHAARTSYGRLLALLAAPTGDLALAEDALADSFERALTAWPRQGVPENPEGWLLTVARNRQRDVWRSAAHRTAAPLDAISERGGATSPLEDIDPDAIGDRRLELMLVCAHPAIDPGIRTPLMLQTVLGLEAAQIATALDVPATTMAQRLVRAKRRIKDTRIPFTIPGRRDLAERLPAVLEAVYGCLAISWRDGPAEDPRSRTGEARYLALTLARLLDDEPEAWGLAALISLSLARGAGRGDRFVPLEEQDPATWDRGLIDDGEALLARAARGRSPGRFELEAAIQAVHCARARTGSTDWAALVTLYEALVTVAPSLGARVARAVVIGRTSGAELGLAALEELSADDFQPYRAARADLLLRAGRTAEAAAAFEQAAALSSVVVEQVHLRRRAREVRRR